MQGCASDEKLEQKRRHALFKEHHRRVRIIAAQVRREQKLPPSMQEDLEAYGAVGLADAVNRFDEGRNVKFGSYAEYRILGEIRKGLETWRSCHGVLVRLQRRKKTADTVDAFIESASELLQETFAAALAADAGRIVGGDTPATPEEEMLRQQSDERLHAMLGELDARKRELLRLSFVEEVKSVDIAAQMGIHKSRVSHLRQEALDELRERIQADEDDEREGG